MKVGIILADGQRKDGESFKDWIRKEVGERLGVPVEMLDYQDAPPSSETIEGDLDAFVVMTPEQNHSFRVVENQSRFFLVPFARLLN